VTAVLSEDVGERTAALARLPQIRVVAVDRLGRLDGLIPSGGSRGYLDAVTEARGRFLVQQDQFVALMQTGRRDEALRLVNGPLREVEQRYLQAIDALIKHETAGMVEAGKAAESFYRQARPVMLGLAVAAVLGVWMTRSIASPLTRTADAANRLAAGDLRVRITAGARDETGQLMAAMQGMVARLVDILTEARGAADTLGRLAGRVSDTASALSQAVAEQVASVDQTRATAGQVAEVSEPKIQDEHRFSSNCHAVIGIVTITGKVSPRTSVSQ
jgi:methyl-accepting chemotaxis protein